MPALGPRTPIRLAVVPGLPWVLAAAVGGGCGDAAAPEAEAPSAAAVEATTAEPPEPPPPEPGAFELPGLADWAPRPRFSWPTESVHLTSSFGWRVDPVSGRGTRLHRGIDLRGSTGDLVLSIGAGRVEFAGHDPLLGNLVIVDHGDGLRSLYGHLSDVLVATDVPVDRGAAIGLVGNTGRSAATHLHLTVTLDGQAIDPLEILGEPPHRPVALIGSPVAPVELEPPIPTIPPASSNPSTVEPVGPEPADLAPEWRPTHPLPHRSDDGGAM